MYYIHMLARVYICTCSYTIGKHAIRTNSQLFSKSGRAITISHSQLLCTISYDYFSPLILQYGPPISVLSVLWKKLVPAGRAILPFLPPIIPCRLSLTPAEIGRKGNTEFLLKVHTHKPSTLHFSRWTRKIAAKIGNGKTENVSFLFFSWRYTRHITQ